MQQPAGNELVSDWDVVVPATDIEILKVLGTGSYGVVSMAKCRGQTVAVKKLKRQQLDPKKIMELKKEIDIMRRLKSSHLVLLMGLCDEPDNISIIMEYVTGRNLYDIIHDKTPLTLEQKLRISKEIAIGCNWLHRLNPPIVHRDLKPDNVMVSADLKQIKLCDFGLSCIKQTEDLKTIVGSPIYMSPERFYGAPGDEKSDIYGWAVTIWELWERADRPFAHIDSFNDLVEAVDREGERPPITEATPAPVALLLKKCWHGEPDRRPTFPEVLAQFDNIIIDTLITDEKGRELWRLATGKDVLFPFYLSWKTFKTFLDEVLGKTLTEDDEVILCLKAQVGEEAEDLTRGDKQTVVRCDKFGKFLEVFGPLSEENLIKFTIVCAGMYYHGDIDSETAKVRLSDWATGSYLIRLSSNERNCLTLSKREKKGCSHQRILKTADKGYVINLGNSPSDVANFRSLKELIRKSKKVLGLTEPCSTGSKFAVIFDREGSEESNYIKPVSASALLALAEKQKKVKKRKVKTHKTEKK